MAQNEVQFITSSRGGRLMAMNGFLYQKKRENAIHVFWYCARRDQDRCLGAAKTLVTLDDAQVTSIQYLDAS